MSDDKFSLGKIDKGGVNEPPISPRPDVKVCPQSFKHKLTEGYQPEVGVGPVSPSKGGSVIKSNYDEENIKKMKEIIEIIMTQHWDLHACRCWICEEGRKVNCYPRNKYLYKKDKGLVTVKEI